MSCAETGSIQPAESIKHSKVLKPSPAIARKGSSILDIIAALLSYKAAFVLRYIVKFAEAMNSNIIEDTMSTG